MFCTKVERNYFIEDIFIVYLQVCFKFCPKYHNKKTGRIYGMITPSNQNRSSNDRQSSLFAPLLANTIAAITVAFKCHSYST